MIGQLSDRDIYDCIGLGSTGDIVSKTLDGFGGWTILWGSSRQRDSTGFKILNIKLQDSFWWKAKSFFGKTVHKCGKYISIAQVEDALLSRLCPKEHTSLALTCRTALVGYSTSCWKSETYSDQEKTCKITLNYRLTFAPGCRHAACLERGWQWSRKTC